jgi:hypothetical protein
VGRAIVNFLSQRHAEGVARAVASLHVDLLNLVEIEGCFMLRKVMEIIAGTRARVWGTPSLGAPVEGFAAARNPLTRTTAPGAGCVHACA